MTIEIKHEESLESKIEKAEKELNNLLRAKKYGVTDIKEAARCGCLHKIDLDILLNKCLLEKIKRGEHLNKSECSHFEANIDIDNKWFINGLNFHYKNKKYSPSFLKKAEKGVYEEIERLNEWKSKLKDGGALSEDEEDFLEIGLTGWYRECWWG